VPHKLTGTREGSTRNNDSAQDRILGGGDGLKGVRLLGPDEGNHPKGGTTTSLEGKSSGRVGGNLGRLVYIKTSWSKLPYNFTTRFIKLDKAVARRRTMQLPKCDESFGGSGRVRLGSKRSLYRAKTENERKIRESEWHD